MVILTEDTFQQFVAAQSNLACICHLGMPPKSIHAHEQMDEVGADHISWAWARIDLADAPRIAAMFGLSGHLPHLLIMRDQIVLHCAQLPDEPGRTHAIMTAAAKLDMQQVRSEVAVERSSRASLFVRRVCPTAWRKP